MPKKNEDSPTTKKDLVEFQDKIVHQFRIISEDLAEKVELVAESVTNVKENLSRVKQKLTDKIDQLGTDLSAVIRVSYIDLVKRVDDLDRRVKDLEKLPRH
jgi:polyhydroxyalkanoate synthesis regulator phasin